MILYQVTRALCKNHAINRLFLSPANSWVTVRNYNKLLVPMQNRKLIKISGNDTTEFLQGLITNDMRHFEEGAQSMYAMFLNNKGRVLYDSLIHKWDDKNTFLIECDKNIYDNLLKHLSIYKLKRTVKYEDINQHYKLWTFITSVKGVTPTLKFNSKSDINTYKDPRLPELGCRILTASHLEASQITDMLGRDIEIGENQDVYTYLRYKLGVSEGSEDLPPGICFPLEVNCDYLHGVSFHKGCYIGQELTARIYHTGVVRKRIMPIKFKKEIETRIEKDTPIIAVDNPKVVFGKLKGYIRDNGLGLVRVKNALDAKELQVGDYLAEIVKPTWWPIEAPKEKIPLTKIET